MDAIVTFYIVRTTHYICKTHPSVKCYLYVLFAGISRTSVFSFAFGGAALLDLLHDLARSGEELKCGFI